MDELIVDLKSMGMKKEDIDEMWTEVSKCEYKQNRSRFPWQTSDRSWGTNALWGQSSVPSSMLDET